MPTQAPDMRGEFDGKLYRAIPLDQLTTYLTDGATAGRRTYWGVLSIAEYYLDDIVGEGEHGTIIEVDLSAFDATQLLPDLPSIDEPINSVIKSNDDAVIEAWTQSDRSWRASLDLIGSVAYDGPLPAAAIREA